VGGETDWRVPALSLPAEQATEPVNALAQSDAVRLFIERAVKVHLAHVDAKLGVPNRAALATAAARRHSDSPTA
jgi:hypothetical protein